MYAGLELIKDYNGESVSLQVRADNIPARHLYDTLNFKEISGTTHLCFNRVPRIEKIPLPPGATLRPHNYDSSDARAAYNLVGAATPLANQKEWPLRHSRFRLGVNEKLNSIFCQLLGGPASAHWVVEDGQRFVGIVNIIPGILGRSHCLELVVHPDWRGRLEKPIISRVLNYLYPWRRIGIDIKHPTYHVEAIEAYREFGCQEDQTLIWMKRKM
jgi:ribosomal protein S18 acetylase RimI-like enzyme